MDGIDSLDEKRRAVGALALPQMADACLAAAKALLDGWKAEPDSFPHGAPGTVRWSDGIDAVVATLPHYSKVDAAWIARVITEDPTLLDEAIDYTDDIRHAIMQAVAARITNTITPALVEHFETGAATPTM